MANILKREFKFVIESMIDFDSLEANDLDLKPFFEKQGWLTFFSRLNGPVFPFLVRDFWKYATVINGGLDGQREIQSSVMGMEVSITQDIVAHVTGAPNEGPFEPDSDKIKNSEIQRHLLLMLVEEEQIHLPAYIFNRFCEALEEGSQKSRCLIQYCRLLSEFFHQAGLIKALEDINASEVLKKTVGDVMNASILIHMKRKSNLNEIITTGKAFRVKGKGRVFVDKYPLIPKLNDLLVISDYLNRESESLT
ncbi:hypothetical protein A2U01_0003343 [Trifolium medium]|uniref:Uncharacterized protein n=1 Tax=Trifolium medium TaxID=97028 RepID=A0A392M5C3_9FABA|nr:hypothetical protein [Trifolium medium]